jgi:RNA polymerase sigma-70 factor, ECF subfamily
LKLPNALQNESGRPDDTTSEMTMDESDLRDQSSSPRVSESDAELAERFEREALVLLDPLYRGALALTGDRLEAEDLLQETMMNAYREFRSFPEGTSLTTWLYRALIGTYVSSRRRRHRWPAECPNTTTIDWQLATAAARSSTGLSSAQVETLEALPTAVITKALHALERDTRMAVYYADVEGFSYREIAHITNRSVSAVMSMLRRGRHQLRNLLLAASRESAAGQFRKDAPKNTALMQPAMPKGAPLHRLSEGDTCAGQLDWFDREIVRYVLQWVPHGQMWDEDVYPMFGMTVEQLVDRFHRIIDASVPGLDRLAKSDRELVDKARQLPAVFEQAG